MILATLLILFPLITVGQYQQPVRVAPGVPPQHYQHDQVGAQHGGIPQQPPHIQQQQLHQQQLHQQQLHQQQLLQQQQQQVPHGHGVPQGVPVQQHVPQVPVQHVPHGQVPTGGHPGHGHEHGKLLDASNVLQERGHIQEHLDLPIDTSQMSEQELQFHYFKMHDADGNNKLDGTELTKSLIHWHDEKNHNPQSGHPVPEPKIFTDEELIQMIDPILKNDDLNQDGQIDYAEFSRAQANAAARANAGQQQH